jgi:hypothetical protein
MVEHLLQYGSGVKATQRDIADSVQRKTICIDVPVRLKRSGRETRMIVGIEDRHQRLGSPNRVLIKMLVRAFDWFEQFQADRSTQQIADALGINRSYVAQVMPLVFLAPDIVEGIFAGRNVEIEKLIAGVPGSWEAQRDRM